MIGKDTGNGCGCPDETTSKFITFEMNGMTIEKAYGFIDMTVALNGLPVKGGWRLFYTRYDPGIGVITRERRVSFYKVKTS
mgnify:FL=1